jgi:membrane dipeptidase
MARELTWFDGHLDLAMLEVLGRDMHAPASTAGGPDLPAGVTLRTLKEGRVSHALATIFVEADGKDPRGSYVSGDAAGAKRAGLAQLRIYERWVLEGHAKWMRGPASHPPGSSPPLTIGILIEGADVIEGPAELGWWKERGVVSVAMAWWKDSRYATGNGHDVNGPNANIGLTILGRELAKEMDRLGVVHDVSHLSDRALDELLSMTSKPVIASHSNSRGLLGDPKNQRHLTDSAIKEIAKRGGMIGLNLYSKFLNATCAEPPRRASIDDCVKHVERVCDLAGGRGSVGLGSDMDGGFSAARLPEGIDLPEHLTRLSDALSLRGWSDREVQGFAHGNWARFWR